ncbi:MAG: inosine/xanthosine triphosphatase [Lentisphaeraceae bacterium]|nr:inosine/xanthosine triphosphatase [Lentisphaeraceae bacterium]
MKLTFKIGSENPVKVNALKECLENLLSIECIDVKGCEVDSGVNDQPQSFQETFAGAKNRAIASYSTGTISFGIEDGIFKIPETEKTYMNVCVCVMYNGSDFHYGCSSAFEYPEEITDLVISRALDISEALGSAGYTGNPEIGSAEGAIGILSEGRLVRKDYTKQAINSALIHLKSFIGNRI